MEASHLLDMKRLMGEIPPNLLLPVSKKQKTIITRSPDNFILLLSIFAFMGSIYQWLRFDASIVLPISGAIFIGIFYQKNRINSIYYVSARGLVVPYTWLYQKILPLDQIIDVYNEKLVSKETGTEIDGVTIVIDNPSVKFNTTGIQEPSIILSSEKYDIPDLEIFADEIRKFKRENNMSPNTLAQRLTDQVDRSWNGRWKLIVLNTVDSSSEFGYYLILINLVFGSLLNIDFTALSLILFLLYFIFVLLYNFADKPSSIIGVRSHELGALIYNEADLLTTVRFVIMGRPFDINILGCELLFKGDPIAQINELKELHPEVVSEGKLTYGVAQFTGNQTKSIGCKIRFSYNDDSDETYELPIYWA